MIGNLISSIVCIIIYTLCCRLFFHFKEKQNHILFLVTLLLLMLIKTLAPIRESLHLNFILSFGTYIIILYFFKNTLAYKAFFFLTYLICSSLCEFFTMRIFSLFFFENVVSNDLAYILGIIVTNLFLLFFMYIISIYWKTFSLKAIPKYSWILLCLPLTTVLLIININDYYQSVVNQTFFIFIVIGLLISNLVCIYIYYKTVTTIAKDAELEIQLKKAEIQNESANQILSQHNVFLHDIRNQSINMMKLLKKGNYTELENYINGIYSDSINIYNMINSNYKIVDVIINDRLYIIKNNSIQLRIQLECTEFPPCNDMEMEMIFKYAIDTGIQACIQSNSDQPSLNIISKKIEKQTILSFSFTSASNNDIQLSSDLKDMLDHYGIYHLIENDPSQLKCTINFLFFEKDISDNKKAFQTIKK